jgi:hypothetical protein
MPSESRRFLLWIQRSPMTKQKASETNSAPRTTAVAELPFKLIGRQGQALRS